MDGVTLRIQGRLFMGFTLHHVHIEKGKTILEVPKFQQKDSTVLFVEAPDVASGVSMRAHLDNYLQLTCGVDFHSMQKRFTVVTDGAAAMARMTNSSVSSRTVERDEKWMRFYVHILQNCMKNAFRRCSDNSALSKVKDDFKSVKNIVEDSKRFRLEQEYFTWIRLIQDVETRFGTFF